VGLAGDLYGTFTIELGVYVPEMVVQEDEARDGWVNEYDCQLRMRAGRLLRNHKDVWWSLDHPDSAAAVATDVLQEAGLPWLDRLASRDAILAAYELVGWSGIGLMPVGPVQIAWLLKERDRERAESVLREYLDTPLSPGHRERFEVWLRGAGFTHLLDARPPT